MNQFYCLGYGCSRLSYLSYQYQFSTYGYRIAIYDIFGSIKPYSTPRNAGASAIAGGKERAKGEGARVQEQVGK